MVIDSKGKLFGKVSIVDVIIVLLIVGSIAGVGYKYTKSGKATPFAKKDIVRVTFRQDEARSFVPNEIHVGDLVKDSNTTSIFGKVVAITTDKSVGFGTNDQGQYVQTSRPNAVSVEIIVEGEAIYRDGITDNGVNFDNTDYFIDKSVLLKVGNAQIWGAIKHFEKKE